MNKQHGRASYPLNIATALILVFPEGFAFHLWGTSFTLFKYPIDLVKWFCDIAAPKPPKHSHCATIGWGPRNTLSHLKNIWRTSCYLFKHPKDSSKWIWNDIVGPAIPLTWSLRYYWWSCPSVEIQTNNQNNPIIISNLSWICHS